MIEHYRKKPLTVATILWDGTEEATTELQEWTGKVERPERIVYRFQPCHFPDECAAIWADEEGCWVRVPIGHRIVQGARGEFYPISPEAVAETYERAV